MGARTIKLNNGREMPLVGFGLWKVNNDTCAEQVYNAIKTGYRLFDEACDYGNEKECGQGIARAIKEGLVKREDLFITTKLWNSFHEKDKVEPIAKRQLADLGLDYVDLFLIHFPVALEYVDPSVKYPPGWGDKPEKMAKVPLSETWAAMESLVDKGLTKSIGVSNYNGSLIMDALRYARIPPAVNQIEHHPYLAQTELVKLLQERNVAITAYSSFGPSSYVELDFKSAKNSPLLMEHPTIKKIADAHKKTPAQVLLRWATQRNIAVIPKSNNQGRLQQNLDVTDWDLSTPELNEVSALDKHLRFNNPPNYGINLPIFA